MLTPRCLLKGETGLTVSSGPRLDGAKERADAGGVNSKLSPVPERKARADDPYPARSAHGDGQACKLTEAPAPQLRPQLVCSRSR